MTLEEIFFTWFHAVDWPTVMATTVSSGLCFLVSALAVVFIFCYYEEFADAMGVATRPALILLVVATLTGTWIFTPMLFWGLVAGLGKVSFDALDWWFSEGCEEHQEALDKFLSTPLA